MGRKHYELGVSLYRRQSFFSRPSLRQLGVVTALVTVLGLGYFGFIPGLPGISERGDNTASEEAHRQSRARTYKDTHGYSSTDAQVRGRASSLRVQPVVVATPTAAPSADDTLQAPDMPDTQSSSPAAGIPPDAVPSPPAVTVSVVTPPLPAISVPAPTGLDNPVKKDIAMQLVSSAENSSLDWKKQYGYIEDIRDGRGYTAGIIGFCSGTGDMLELVQYYTKIKPGNVLSKYISALQQLNGSPSHAGLDPTFVSDWKTAAADPAFQRAQNDERDRVYFNPAVSQAKADGLRELGQFIYYDAMVMHGPGDDTESFGGIRAVALKNAKTPAQGGDEAAYLNAFLDARVAAMKQEAAHDDVSRVETAQRAFLKAGNFDLAAPLSWKVYGESFSIK